MGVRGLILHVLSSWPIGLSIARRMRQRRVPRQGLGTRGIVWVAAGDMGEGRQGPPGVHALGRAWQACRGMPRAPRRPRDGPARSCRAPPGRCGVRKTSSSCDARRAVDAGENGHKRSHVCA